MDNNNSDSSTSKTDEEEDESGRKHEIKSGDSTAPKVSLKQCSDLTDEPIMEEHQTIPVSKQQFEEDKKAVYKVCLK